MDLLLGRSLGFEAPNVREPPPIPVAVRRDRPSATDGVVTPMSVVPGSGPTGISTDARGQIRFLGHESNRVYRMML